MPRFVIEREIPGAGKLSPAELQGISQKSCSVLRELGPTVQWDRRRRRQKVRFNVRSASRTILIIPVLR